jgi:diguanylate cyclase (GGDEF)-like protein
MAAAVCLYILHRGRQTFRQSAIIARVGGDEFVVLLSKAGPGIESAIRRRIDRLMKVCTVTDGTHLKSSLSIGFTNIDPRQNCSLEDLINEADRSMYKRKRQRKAALTGNKTGDSTTVSV